LEGDVGVRAVIQKKGFGKGKKKRILGGGTSWRRHPNDSDGKEERNLSRERVASQDMERVETGGGPTSPTLNRETGKGLGIVRSATD